MGREDFRFVSLTQGQRRSPRGLRTDGFIDLAPNCLSVFQPDTVVYESGMVDAHEAVAMTVKANSSNFCDFITAPSCSDTSKHICISITPLISRKEPGVLAGYLSQTPVTPQIPHPEAQEGKLCDP